MNLRAAKIRAAKMAVAAFSGFSSHHEATGARVPVLCYHRVLPGLKEGEKPLYTLTPEEFAGQMDFLARRGFRSLSLEEYAFFARGGPAPPERAVLVTFDDGYADGYHQAWAIAMRHAIKINLFVCTGLIEKDLPQTHGELTPEARANREQYPELWRPLTWLEINRMAENGVGIGFHSHGHRNFGQMTAAEVTEDLATGLRLFDRRLGLHPRAFAFPGGGSGTYNAEIVSLLRNHGLELLFTTRLGRTHLGSDEVLFSRLVIYQDDDLEVFGRKLLGAYDWLGRVRNVDQYLRELLTR
jgi:peptidoglycan/xylan/chitin deacetylase (PgdA/CDA1 family)